MLGTAAGISGTAAPAPAPAAVNAAGNTNGLKITQFNYKIGSEKGEIGLGYGLKLMENFLRCFNMWNVVNMPADKDWDLDADDAERILEQQALWHIRNMLGKQLMAKTLKKKHANEIWIALTEVE